MLNESLIASYFETLRSSGVSIQSGLGEEARRSHHFNVRIESGPGIYCAASQRTLKRAEARAPLALDVGRSISQVSLTPGFSRVGCAADEGNGFNRFPCATAAKPLKRLGRRPRLLTGLEPGANEMPRGSSLSVASQTRHREPEQTKTLYR